jgi:hypothetical protein
MKIKKWYKVEFPKMGNIKQVYIANDEDVKAINDKAPQKTDFWELYRELRRSGIKSIKLK